MCKFRNTDIFTIKMRSMKTEFQNLIILKLKLLREKHGFTQASLAKILNISAGQLGNIESSKHSHKYTIKQISILCKYFNISFIDLFLPNASLIDSNTVDDIVQQIIKYQEK